MLANLKDPGWWFMEVPRTGTSTLERTLKQIWPQSHAVCAKHWPLRPPPLFAMANPASIISVRNPFSRAVSCWQFFSHPGELSFDAWLLARHRDDFFDVNIEARPQSYWYDLWEWTYVIRQEELASDFWRTVHALDPAIVQFPLKRFNDINGPWVNRVRAKTSRDRPWQEYYNKTAEDLVLELYAKDFESLKDYYPSKF